MSDLWDRKMANDAAVVAQCQTLGGVVVEPPKATGFGERVVSPPAPHPGDPEPRRPDPGA